MPYFYQCNDCNAKYKIENLNFICQCGGMLDIAEEDISFKMEDIIKNEWSLFRYLKLLPFYSDSTVWKEVTMGEGFTPLVPLDKLNENILVKMDYMMPTLSFKDRGAVVLIAKAKELGIKELVQDSSGNSATSVAAYSKRTGISCQIFVPEGTSSKKIEQISAYGAQINIIEGNREDTAKAALKSVTDSNSFYASHVYNPFFYQGTKTFIFEIFEQLEGNLPDTLVLPVGNGTLVLGAYYGMQDLKKAGLIGHYPKIIAIQSENCCPIYQAFIQGKDYVEEVESYPTLAEGIAIADPKRGGQVLQAIRDTGGYLITAVEDQIEDAKSYLADRGFHVEPTTAATFAAYFKHLEEKPELKEERVVIPLCGAGLKSDS